MTAFRTILLLSLAAALAPLSAAPLADEVVERAASQIDRLLIGDIRAAGRVPESIVDDATFVRRAYLTIVGRIPTSTEAAAFLDDRGVSKRRNLVEKLTASPGFDSHLFNWAGDLLRVQTKQDQYGLGWHVWLRQSLADNKPWDDLVREMLTANGHSSSDPAVGYYLRDRNMQLDNFSNTMQVFLGQQIGCAQCHDHPFADWTQYEYYQMASFTGGVQYRSDDAQQVIRKVANELYESEKKDQPVAGNNDKRSHKEKQEERRAIQENFRKVSRGLGPIFGQVAKNAIAEQPDAQLRLPKDYKYKDAKPGDVVPPETLFGPKLKDVPPEQRKTAFAEWVTSPDNPYFTRTIVNRMWERTFGYPLLDSLDNLSAKSKTAHPKVLELLEHAMKQCDYDLRQFNRILYRTQLFQRACMREEPPMGEALVFQGMVLRRMTAEQLYDSFLVLRSGEIDDGISDNNRARWQGYVEMINSLFNAKSRELLLLGESARQGEDRLVKARRDYAEARKVLADASSREAKIKAQAEVNRTREEFEQARLQANPFSGSMMEMSSADRGERKLRRASEMPAPFSPATLVRDFGGSDREAPSSGHAEATVPQALALLNDWKTNVLDPKSELARELKAQSTPESRLDVLFLTLFSERPPAAEKQRYLSMAKDITSLRDLATAMLNSKRFLFIE